MLPDFELARPRSVREAVDLLSFEAVAYAGGTELLLAMKMGFFRPSKLIDLKHIPNLNHIERQDSEIVVGAAATHRQIETNDLIQAQLGFLAEVEHHVGNPRVRSVGTIGGNLCFAEPKSDVATALIALDAEVVLESPSGSRRMSVDEFTVGPYTTTREDDELLTYIHIPLDGFRRGVYLKYQTMERPTLGIAMVDTNKGDVPIRTVVVGAVGGRPVRFDFDEGEDIDPQTIAQQVEPIPDLTGSVRYKRHIVAVYVQRALERISTAESQ